MAMVRRSARLCGFSQADMETAVARSLIDAERHSPLNVSPREQQEAQQIQEPMIPKTFTRRRKRGQPVQRKDQPSDGDAEAMPPERMDEESQSEPEESKSKQDADADYVHEQRSAKRRPGRPRTPGSTKRKRRKRDAVRSHFGYAEPADKKDSSAGGGSCSKKMEDVFYLEDDGGQSCREIEAKEGKLYAYPSRDDSNAVPFRHSDIKCLDETEYINDTVVALYIRHMQLSASRSQEQIYVFSSFFYSKLSLAVCRESPEELESLRKWMKGVDIFEKTYLLIPVHDRLHWSLAIICFTDPKPGCVILHLDSMRTGHASNIVYEVLRRYLVAEWTSRGGSKVDIRKSHRVKKVKVPQQKNEYDCGLFMLHFIQKVLLNAPPLFNPDMPNIMSEWFSFLEASSLRASIRGIVQKCLKQQSTPEKEPQEQAGEAPRPQERTREQDLCGVTKPQERDSPAGESEAAKPQGEAPSEATKPQVSQAGEA